MATSHINDLPRNLIENAVKAKRQILYDEVLSDNYDKADEILNTYPDIKITEVKEFIEKRRGSP